MTSPESCNHDTKAFRGANDKTDHPDRVWCMDCNTTLFTEKIARQMKANERVSFRWNDQEERYVEA